MDDVFDVVIIGAGPAGSSTANVIAENGFKVALVERDSFPGENNVCAGGMPKFVIDKLGLEDAIEKEIEADVIYFPWGEKRIKRKNVTVYRHIFDKLLAERAVEKGAKLFTKNVVMDVSIEDDHVVVIGTNKSFKSKLVVFADGPNTLAYRKFGIGFKPEKDKTVVAVVCEVECKNNPYNEFEMYADPKIVEWGYGWVFPKKNTVNIGVGCLYSFLGDNILKRLKYFIESYKPVSSRFRGRQMVWLRASPIPACPAEKIYGNRMLVVGDAAGMVDPISGGGIFHAITGGTIAGQVCVEALSEENFSADYLSIYQRKWFRTTNYKNIKIRYALSTIFMLMYRLDRKSYAKLMNFGYGTESKFKKILTYILK